MTSRSVVNRIAGYQKGQITAICVAASVLAGLCIWQYSEAPRRYRVFVENSTQGIEVAQRDLDEAQKGSAGARAAADSTLEQIKSISETGGNARFLYAEAKQERLMYESDSTFVVFRERMVRLAQDERSRALESRLRWSEIVQLALVIFMIALILAPAGIVFMWLGKRGTIPSLDERIVPNV